MIGLNQLVIVKHLHIQPQPMEQLYLGGLHLIQQLEHLAFQQQMQIMWELIRFRLQEQRLGMPLLSQVLILGL